MTTRPGRGSHAAHVALALAQLGFGVFPIFGKVVFPPRGEVPALAVASLRGVFGALAFGLLAAAMRAPRVERRTDLGHLAVNAFFGVVVNQIFFLEGLERSSATHAGVLVAASPAIAYGLAILLRREGASAGAVLGVALAVAGAAWIVLLRPAAGTAGRDPLVGDALLFTNVASYAVYLVRVKDVLQRVEPVRAMAWVFFFGALANVPLGLREVCRVDWGRVSPGTWWGLAYIMVFPTFVCYALNAYALTRLPATIAAVYTTLQPIVATSGAALILGERPQLLPTAGAITLILSGVVLVAFGRPPVTLGPGLEPAPAEGPRPRPAPVIHEATEGEAP